MERNRRILAVFSYRIQGVTEMKTKRHVLIGAFLVLTALSVARLAAGQGTPQAEPNSTRQPAATSQVPQNAPYETGSTIRSQNRRYTVHPSDTLQLGFKLSPEFNQTVTVQPDGYITLLYVGDMSAAGHTLPELTAAIKTAYSKILHDPVISVAPTDFEKPYFVVGGQVGKPGKFDWRGEVTVTQAVALAGGFTDASKHSQVLLFRRVSDQWTASQDNQREENVEFAKSARGPGATARRHAVRSQERAVKDQAVPAD